MRSRIVGYAIAASAVIILVSQTGCTNRAHIFGSGPDFEMSGTAEGLQAFYDGNVGQIKTGKESPDAHSEHFAFRGAQEKEKTKRETKPDFLSKLFAPSTSGGAESTNPSKY